VTRRNKAAHLDTTGASLPAGSQCSPTHVRTPVQDNRSVYGCYTSLHTTLGPAQTLGDLRRLAQQLASFGTVERRCTAKIRAVTARE